MLEKELFNVVNDFRSKNEEKLVEEVNNKIAQIIISLEKKGDNIDTK